VLRPRYAAREGLRDVQTRTTVIDPGRFTRGGRLIIGISPLDDWIIATGHTTSISDPKSETDPMDAQPTLRPIDRTFRAYGPGQLDDASAESVDAHLRDGPDGCRRVADLSSASALRRLRDANARPESFGPAVAATDGLSLLDAGGAAPAPAPASSLPPALADHPEYEILRELGQGGMGVVYLARNTLMSRLEVLKVTGGHLVNRRDVVDRFVTEIRNAARLHHPNVVTAYSAIRLGESLVLAMEYVEGLDLSRLVKARGPLPVANACNYIHQAALGLQHAHEHGMVHRDIKPGNLMLTRQGNRALIKVLDFGLAKIKGERPTDGTLTNEGQMLGTPHYVAPEQIRDAQSADIRADIYSLGCTFYHLLTGKPPFGGTSLYDVLQAHHSMEAMPLNLRRPEVPVELAALVAKEPARRFQEPKEVAQSLRPFFRSGPQEPARSVPDISRGGEMVADRDAPRAGAMSAPPTDLSSSRTRREYAEMSRPEATFEPASRGTKDGTTEVAGRSRRASGAGWAIAGVLLIGFAVAWAAVVFKVKTEDGVIVLEGVPAGAVVEVDGGRITITPRAGQPVRIEQPAGTHRVRVARGGDQLLGEDVTLESGKESRLTVRIERPARTDVADKAWAVGGQQGSNARVPPRTDKVTPADRSRGLADRDRPAIGQERGERLEKGARDGGPGPRPPGFVPLFHSTDLAEWEDARPENTSEWRVIDGVLEGTSGGGPGILITRRRDFKNYRLRVVYKFTKGGNGRIEVRRSGTTERTSCYAVSLVVWPHPMAEEWPAGNIKKYTNHRYGARFGVPRTSKDTHASREARHTLEIVANGDRISTSVDGTEADEFTDKKARNRSGQIALICGMGSKVEFADLSIQELPDDTGGF
jgi:serine/threonine protein kinase